MIHRSPSAQVPFLGTAVLAVLLMLPLATLQLSSAALAQDDAAVLGGETDTEEWLLDEERGQRYKVAKVPKIEGSYRWVDESTVRFRHGIYFDIVDHDDEYFWVKSWESVRKELAPPPKQEDVEVRKARIAGTYETTTVESDRIEMVSFDEGLPTRGQWRQGFDIADANNDGHLDIVFGPPRKTHRPIPNIFLGDGEGKWKLWRTSYPRAPYDYGAATAGDLNGDGLTDLVFGVHLRGLLALVADGKGGFVLWNEGIGIDDPGRGGDATNFSARAVDLIDWNGDGKLDILALGEGPKGRKQGPKGQISGEIINNSRGLAVWVNQGDGSWVPERPGDASGMSFDFGDGFARGDFNSDGKEDIALASRRMSSRSLLGVFNEDLGLWETRNLDGLRARSFIGSVATEDLDGDGDSELIIGYQSHEEDDVVRTGIDVFYPDGDLEWERRPILVTEGRRGIYAVDSGDFDGDGHPDLAGITGDGELWLLLADGEGGFSHEVSPEAPEVIGGCRGYGLKFRDLDGDGSDEIVAAFAGEQTGFPGLPGMSNPGCPGGGSIRVWKAETKKVGEAPASAP